MGDSDDEYDRRGRGRDKFRRERNDYQDARPPPPSVRRDDWTERPDSTVPTGNSSTGGSTGGGGWSTSTSLARDRNNQSRRDNYGRDSYGGGGGGLNRYGGRNDRYSADRSGDMSPPSKRIRSRDWDDRYPNYELGGGHHGGHYGSSSGGGNSGSHHRDSSWSHDRDRDDEQYQPPMMTLKQFLNDQDDHIEEDTLITKYNEYKSDFRKQQIQEFFNRHKDEEWFRCKYFPDEIDKRKERQAATYQRRLEVFMELYENKYFDNVSLDVDKADQIVRVLDAVVIKLEGGSDLDLKSLDEPGADDTLPKKADASGSIFAVESASSSKASGVVVTPKAIKVDGGADSGLAADAKANDSGMEDETGEIREPDQSECGDNNGASKIDDGNADSIAEPDDELGSKPTEIGGFNAEDSNDGELPEEGEELTSTTNNKKATHDDGEIQDPASPDQGGQGGDSQDSQSNSEPGPVKPRPLHKTCSIFFRNLAPSITRQEIEDECKKFPGFLRLAISEPQMDRRFNRRGWATFERTVSIREICWALNSVKIRGTEIGPIVNRDLTRRIRSVNGISSHKSVVRADIRHAAKLIMKLDEEKGLWKDEDLSGGDQDSSKPSNGGQQHSVIAMPSRNPLLKNITDYLIEEASAEEEELLGGSIDLDAEMKAAGEDGLDAGEEGAATNGNGALPEGSCLERDEELIRVLDRMLFYLRIVHSTDYYSHAEYPSEDEMPNRIGLIHARGLFSSARVAPAEITDYVKEGETKVAPLLAVTPIVTPEESRKLGLKDIEDAVEVFIKENTKELGEGKWLCPLSNKKFMGPEFVRKHILNKHLERVDQVRAETHYFNNYVLDPKRPQLPEHPFNLKASGGGGGSSSSSRPSGDGHRGDMHGGLMSGGGYGGGNHGGYGYNRGHNYGPGGRYQLHTQDFRSGMKRSRHNYRDLDAPVDDF